MFLRKHVQGADGARSTTACCGVLRPAAATSACGTAPRRSPSASSIFGASLLLVPFIGAEFMPHLDEGALWVRATMPYTISFDEASKLGPQVRDILLELSAGDDRRQRARPARRRHRSDRLLQRRVLRRPEAVRRSGVERVDPDQAAADRRDPEEAAGVSRASSSTTRSRPRTRSTKPRPASRARSR